MLAAMDSDLVPEHGEARKVNAVTRRLADVTAARQRLGWKAEIGLDDGLRGLVEWWRAEQAAAALPTH
jgi:UDP-glucose 4-epimerase